jgi:hypothetical protein
MIEDRDPSIRAWIDHVTRLVGPTWVWFRGVQFGHWLDPERISGRRAY